MVALEDAPEPMQDEIDNQREEFRDYRPHGRILGFGPSRWRGGRYA
jgi:hypothetical protein